MKIVKGDLLKLAAEGNFDGIAHGCNCFHTMGAGIARQIVELWPEVLEIDKETKYGDIFKLGGFSKCKREGDRTFDIFNFYTQFDIGRSFEYTALMSCLKELEYFSERMLGMSTYKLGVPLIGGGIGGGLETVIRDILTRFDDRSKVVNITLVEYEG